MKKSLMIFLWLLSLPLAAMAQHLDSIEIHLRNNVKFMTDPRWEGRAAGTEGEREVSRFLYRELARAGVTMLVPESGDDFMLALQDTLHSRNVVGVVEGYDPQLKNEFVVIAAHYDHIGTHVLTRNGEKQVQVFPGADANASGVATLLEVAKQVAAQNFLFRRSVIFALFGAEEIGLYGSWYFLNRSFEHVADISAMINLDMVGRSSGDNRLQVYTANSNVEVMSILRTLSARPLSIAPEYSPVDYVPSSHRMFYEKQIPVVLFTSGIHRDYHTVRDVPDRLDYNQMERLAEYVFSMTEVIAGLDKKIGRGPSRERPAGNAAVYTQSQVDRRATFIHGDEAQFLNRWVYQYIKYPESSIAGGISGTVVAEFTVNQDGRVEDVRIVRGLDDEINAEVDKVLRASPKWKPAQIKGTDVSVRISIPIEFKLSKSSVFKIKK